MWNPINSKDDFWFSFVEVEGGKYYWVYLDWDHALRPEYRLVMAIATTKGQDWDCEQTADGVRVVVIRSNFIREATPLEVLGNI